MFTQVYFHKTRVAYDRHLHEALKEILPNGWFPGPDGNGLDEYSQWEDWRVLGLLAQGQGGEHGARLASRNHYREVFHTVETPTDTELQELERVREGLGTLVAAEESAETSWYKSDLSDIPVVTETKQGNVRPLSNYSGVVANLKPNHQVLLYARPEDCEQAREIVSRIVGAQND